MQTPHLRYELSDCRAKLTNTPHEAKQNGPPHWGQRSVLIQFVMIQSNHVDIVRFGSKGPSRLWNVSIRLRGAHTYIVLETFSFI